MSYDMEKGGYCFGEILTTDKLPHTGEPCSGEVAYRVGYVNPNKCYKTPKTKDLTRVRWYKGVGWLSDREVIERMQAGLKRADTRRD